MRTHFYALLLLCLVVFALLSNFELSLLAGAESARPFSASQPPSNTIFSGHFRFTNGSSAFANWVVSSGTNYVRGNGTDADVLDADYKLLGNATYTFLVVGNYLGGAGFRWLQSFDLSIAEGTSREFTFLVPSQSNELVQHHPYIMCQETGANAKILGWNSMINIVTGEVDVNVNVTAQSQKLVMLHTSADLNYSATPRYVLDSVSVNGSVIDRRSISIIIHTETSVQSASPSAVEDTCQILCTPSSLTTFAYVFSQIPANYVPVEVRQCSHNERRQEIEKMMLIDAHNSSKTYAPTHLSPQFVVPSDKNYTLVTEPSNTSLATTIIPLPLSFNPSLHTLPTVNCGICMVDIYLQSKSELVEFSATASARLSQEIDRILLPPGANLDTVDLPPSINSGSSIGQLNITDAQAEESVKFKWIQVALPADYEVVNATFQTDNGNIPKYVTYIADRDKILTDMAAPGHSHVTPLILDYRSLSQIRITALHLRKTIIVRGNSMNMTVVVENKGNASETFNLAIYTNSSTMAPPQTSSLDAAGQTSLPFMWNTTGFAFGSYVLTANAKNSSGVILVHVRFSGTSLTLSIQGDANGDGRVNVLDLITIAIHLGQSNGGGYMPDSPQWYQFWNSDLNNDGKINVLDLIICATHLSQHWNTNQTS